VWGGERNDEAVKEEKEVKEATGKESRKGEVEVDRDRRNQRELLAT
jgi:hypothetical protein